MGTFAKIFIVVNLVLAVVFLGAASTLLGTIEDYKTQWEEVRDEYKEKQDEWNSKKAELEADVRSLKTQKETAEKRKGELEVIEKQRTEEWQALKVQFNQQTQTLQEYAASIKDFEQNLEDARTTIEGLNTKYEGALSDTRSAKQAADDLRNDLERANGQIKQLEGDLAAVQKEKTALAEEVQKKANLIAMINERLGADWIQGLQDMPDIKGQVTGVDEDLNIVLVSVGEDDLVKVGFTMTVFRGGEYVGKLVIDKVGPDWASGHMDQGVTKSFPMKGDEVATQL
jgi:hypothetical protein